MSLRWHTIKTGVRFKQRLERRLTLSRHSRGGENKINKPWKTLQETWVGEFAPGGAKQRLKYRNVISSRNWSGG